MCLAQAAWFVWGARQSYRVFWFAELDVLVGSTWAAIVATWPLGGAGSHDERLVCANFGHRDRDWPWLQPRKCSFCDTTSHMHLKAGLLALTGCTRGLVDAIDATLRNGSLRAHHELLVPTVCARFAEDGSGRGCTTTRMEAHPGTKTLLLTAMLPWRPALVCPIKAAMREEHAACAARSQGGGACATRVAALRRRAKATAHDVAEAHCIRRTRPRLAAACRDAASVCIFHPAKCSALRPDGLLFKSLATFHSARRPRGGHPLPPLPGRVGASAVRSSLSLAVQ